MRAVLLGVFSILFVGPSFAENADFDYAQMFYNSCVANAESLMNGSAFVDEPPPSMESVAENYFTQTLGLPNPVRRRVWAPLGQEDDSVFVVKQHIRLDEVDYAECVMALDDQVGAEVSRGIQVGFPAELRDRAIENFAVYERLYTQVADSTWLLKIAYPVSGEESLVLLSSTSVLKMSKKSKN